MKNKYHQRQRNLYDKNSKFPFKISRSKIDLFLECPRCFYLDRRLGLGRPSMPGWALNSAVDQLLKNEFDLLRKKGEQHELMKQYKISETRKIQVIDVEFFVSRTDPEQIPIRQLAEREKSKDLLLPVSVLGV